jgi:hypothetical protein
MSPDDANDILTDPCSVDPIADGICRSDGRLNAYKALVAAVPSAGYISLDKADYNCDCNVGISLADCDIKGQGPVDVNITASGGDWEIVSLTETDSNSGIFAGSISTSDGTVDTNDGTLQVSDGNTITVTYVDANDGEGNKVDVNDTADIDCVDPSIISDVNVTVIGPDVTVTFETSEYSLGRVLFGTDCNQTVTISTDFGTEHSIKLIEVSPWTDYYFKVTATDAAGNQVSDDNDSNCYTFSTDGPNDFNVPGDFNTIQKAIDYSWDGGTVTVAEGTYNETVSFKARAITVRSTDPNDWDVVGNTIIDSNILASVVFNSGEDANSVISGVTLKGGWSIETVNSDPTISNCIIDGISFGVVCLKGASPTISNNTIKGRSAGIWSYGSPGSGAIVKNNRIYGNGIGILVRGNSPLIRNNTICYNTVYGIAQARGVAEPNISNCVLWGNGDDLHDAFSATYSCIEDCNDANGTGNICGDGNNPLFVNAFDFIDETDGNGTTTTIIVADANLYELNDVIEYDDDAVARTVSDVNTTTDVVTFAPALDSNSVEEIFVHNWGPGVTDVNEDFHLDVNSACIDAGDPNGDYEGEVDIDGQPRVMMAEADMGADETCYFPPDHNDYSECVISLRTIMIIPNGSPWASPSAGAISDSAAAIRIIALRTSTITGYQRMTRVFTMRPTASLIAT